jgi:hypothetical protein
MFTMEHLEAFDVKSVEGFVDNRTSYRIVAVFTNKDVRVSTFRNKIERFNKAKRYDINKIVLRNLSSADAEIMTISRKEGEHITNNSFYRCIQAAKARGDPTYHIWPGTSDEVKTRRLRQQLGIDMEKPFEDGEETRKRLAQEPAPKPVKKSKAYVPTAIPPGGRVAKPSGRPAKNRTVSDRMMYTASILCSMGARGALDSAPSVEAEEILREDPAPQAAEEEEDPAAFGIGGIDTEESDEEAHPGNKRARTVRGDPFAFADKWMNIQRQDAEKHADLRVKMVEMTTKTLTERLQKSEADGLELETRLKNSERNLLAMNLRQHEIDASHAKVVREFTQKLEDSERRRLELERRLHETDADHAKVTQRLQDSERQRLELEQEMEDLVDNVYETLKKADDMIEDLSASSAGIATERLEHARLKEKARATIDDLLQDLQQINIDSKQTTDELVQTKKLLDLEQTTRREREAMDRMYSNYRTPIWNDSVVQIRTLEAEIRILRAVIQAERLNNRSAGPQTAAV